MIFFNRLFFITSLFPLNAVFPVLQIFLNEASINFCAFVKKNEGRVPEKYRLREIYRKKYL